MYSCKLRITGLMDIKAFKDLVSTLHRHDTRVEIRHGLYGPDNIAKSLQEGDWFYLVQMRRAGVPDDLAHIMDTACLNYIWAVESAGSGALRTIHDATTGEHFTVAVHNDRIVIPLSYIDDPIARSQAIKAETFLLDEAGIYTYDSQHSLMALLHHHPDLIGFHTARSTRG